VFIRSSLALLISAAVLTCITGCGAGNGQGQSQSYAQDGMLGITSANPNLPGNTTYHTYSKDVRMLKEQVAQIPGVTDSTVVMNGVTAYVTLQLRDDVDIEESMRIRNSAQTSLQRLMPRYDVHVSVGKNRLFQ
jgi:hypothetical protein